MTPYAEEQGVGTQSKMEEHSFSRIGEITRQNLLTWNLTDRTINSQTVSVLKTI